MFGGLGPEYRKLWAARVVSNLGDGITPVAGPLLAASLTRDPVLVAGLSFVQRVPWLLFPLVSGALVDRLDRRRTMGMVDVLRAALIGLLGLAVLGGFADLPLLYVVFFLLGTTETLFDNAAQAIMPSVVRREQLEKANGRLFAAEIVSNQFAGPPLGGFLFGVAAAAGAIGGLAGGLVADRIVGVLGTGWALRAAILVNIAMFVVVALSESAVVVWASYLLVGVSVVVWNVITVSFRQAVVRRRSSVG